MWLVRINMTDLTSRVEPIPEAYRYLGGRGITSFIIADEVPPLCHPLGHNNKLILAPGLVTGTFAPTATRLSVGAKSPLSGGIKETNTASSWSRDLAVMQVKAIIVEGQPQQKDKFWGIHLTWSTADRLPQVKFFDATQYIGQDLHQIFPQVYGRWGNNVSIAGCGMAGEYGYGNSGIVFNDEAGRPSRYAARGGLGAVMGSKRLKFIIVNAEGAPGVPITDQTLFEQGRKKLTDTLLAHRLTQAQGSLHRYGTAVLVHMMNEAGGLPTRNFSSGRFEGADKITGEAILAGARQRTGKEIYNHACSPGCISPCTNTWYAANGAEIVSNVNYESDSALGANCGIDNLDDIAEMVRWCHAYGLDPIETGATLGVAMEAGVIPFGASQDAINLIHEMGKGTSLGRLLGGGTSLAGKAFGVTRVPVVKGQGMPACDPRAVKDIGILYATSPLGADTLESEILSVGGKPTSLTSKDQATLSRRLQATTAFIDTSGHCQVIASVILDSASGLEGMIDECNGVLGTRWTKEDVIALGASILKKERAFNDAAGFTKTDDRMPEFMRDEPLPPYNRVFDVPDSTLDSVHATL